MRFHTFKYGSDKLPGPGTFSISETNSGFSFSFYAPFQANNFHLSFKDMKSYEDVRGMNHHQLKACSILQGYLKADNTWDSESRFSFQTN